MIGCFTETTICVVAKPLVIIIEEGYTIDLIFRAQKSSTHGYSGWMDRCVHLYTNYKVSIHR